MSSVETPTTSPAALPPLAVEPSLDHGLASDRGVVAHEPERDAAREREDRRPRALTFDDVYRSYAPFVWRNARRLGVSFGAVEDVMQEVFLVVHRRLPEFEERTSVRAWLSAILIRVVRAHRRKNRAADTAPPLPDADVLADRRSPGPEEVAGRDEAVRELYAILARMNEERREVLVLSELEELSAPEIAQALQVNVNTVSWRLRKARQEFERMVVRRRAARPGNPP
jgi:RNA polymerase sigma-70 factor (ECF subfamily)